MKTKQRILEEQGWFCIEGYVIENSEGENTVISKEEIVEMIFKEPELHYGHEDYDMMMDEDSAWDNFITDWFDENDIELSDNDMIELFSMEVE